MDGNTQVGNAMETEALFREHEYILLTKAYRGIPADSVGRITEVYPTHPPTYQVSFSPSLPRGPIPELYLMRLGPPGRRTLRS